MTSVGLPISVGNCFAFLRAINRPFEVQFRWCQRQLCDVQVLFSDMWINRHESRIVDDCKVEQVDGVIGTKAEMLQSKRLGKPRPAVDVSESKLFATAGRPCSRLLAHQRIRSRPGDFNRSNAGTRPAGGRARRSIERQITHSRDASPHGFECHLINVARTTEGLSLIHI